MRSRRLLRKSELSFYTLPIRFGDQANIIRVNGKKMCMNVYDVRLMDDWPACGMNWPRDLPDVYDFLRVSRRVTTFNTAYERLLI